MKRIGTRTLVLAAIVAMCGCQAADDKPWFDGDLDAALVESAQRGQLVLLDFYADT